MYIDKKDSHSITITLSSDVDRFGLQRLIDYAKYLEITAKSKAKSSEINKLASEMNASWWSKNQKRLLK